MGSTRAPLTSVASRVYLYGCQCQPRHTVRTDISWPRTFAARIGTGPLAQERNRRTIHACWSSVSQPGTSTASGPGVLRSRGSGSGVKRVMRESLSLVEGEVSFADGPLETVR